VFINIVQFPPVKQGKNQEFRAWFACSSAEYAKHEGFIRRRLLKPREGGTYAAIVEHESHETFMAMHTSSTQAEAEKRSTRSSREPNPALLRSGPGLAPSRRGLGTRYSRGAMTGQGQAACSERSFRRVIHATQ